MRRHRKTELIHARVREAGAELVESPASLAVVSDINALRGLEFGLSRHEAMWRAGNWLGGRDKNVPRQRCAPTKMCRAITIKGMEALMAEYVPGAARYGGDAMREC